MINKAKLFVHNCVLAVLHRLLVAASDVMMSAQEGTANVEKKNTESSWKRGILNLRGKEKY